MRKFIGFLLLGLALGLAGCFEPARAAWVEKPKVTREVVFFPEAQAGNIVIDTKRHRLYFGLGGGMAVRYGIGVARAGFTWNDSVVVGNKRQWPEWIPPAEMLARRPDLPRRMEGGIENPLGARALYLHKNGRDTIFRIHGTNEPHTIGQNVSSGCIRMINDDVIDLYDRVQVGARVDVR